MSNLFKGAALFLGGAIAGAAAALLLSPKTGEQVRKDISDLAAEAKKRAQEYCDQVKKEAEQVEAAAEAAVAAARATMEEAQKAKSPKKPKKEA